MSEKKFTKGDMVAFDDNINKVGILIKEYVDDPGFDRWWWILSDNEMEPYPEWSIRRLDERL